MVSITKFHIVNYFLQHSAFSIRHSALSKEERKTDSGQQGAEGCPKSQNQLSAIGSQQSETATDCLSTEALAEVGRWQAAECGFRFRKQLFGQAPDSRIRNYLILFLILLSGNLPLYALEKPGGELKSVKLDNVLGQKIDLNLKFAKSDGKVVPLSEFFDDKPIVLVPGYFTCPRLCGMVFGGMANLVKNSSLAPGEAKEKDYKILTVSFDDKDTPEVAAKKEQHFKKLLGEKDSPGAWHFLSGDAGNIQQLMTQIGFKYLRDGKEFAHAATIYILTPDGVISQFFNGVEFSPFDFKLAIVEASSGRVGSFLDQALLFCFRFDHTKGKYTWVVDGSLKIGGALTLLLLGGFLLRLWRNP